MNGRNSFFCGSVSWTGERVRKEEARRSGVCRGAAAPSVIRRLTDSGLLTALCVFYSRVRRSTASEMCDPS